MSSTCRMTRCANSIRSSEMPFYTALQALHDAARSDNARQFLEFHEAMIPSYWEQPKILDDYLGDARRKHKNSGVRRR
jgi:hypothetical protein